MKILLIILLLLSGCSFTKTIGTITLDDKSTVTYIECRSSGFIGATIVTIDRYQYDKTTDTIKLIRSDSAGGISQLPTIPIPF